MVFLCQFIHCDALLLGPANFELRITIYWISLETIVNSIIILFWYISSARCGPQNALSVLRLCRAEHRGVSPSWWRSAGSREHPVAIGENCGWIRFQPRDVHKCNRSLLDSNRRHSEHCTFGIVSHNSNNSTLLISRTIAFESSLNGL